MRLFLIVIFLVLSQISLFSQKNSEVIIEGYAQFAVGSEIRLIALSDYISLIPNVIAKEKIDETGYFKLTCQTNRVQLVQIAIQTSKAEFFIFPGLHANVEINMDTFLFQQLDPMDYNGYLEVKSLAIDTNDLNYKINRFLTFYENILDSYFDDIFLFKNHTYYDLLLVEINDNFEINYQPDNFYLSYIFYTIAEIETFFYSKEPQKIYNKYFNNEYILYDNPAYMNLFNKFYNSYLHLSPRISREILERYINEKADYLSLFNEAGKDYLLVNERIRELVIIKNLSQLYYNEDYNTQNILVLLNYIKNYTRFDEHKMIIENILLSFDQKTLSLLAQETTLKTPTGTDLKLKDLNGKWVYVQFFSSTCIDCIREMQLINKLHELYQDTICFVSISVDMENKKFDNFKNSYKDFDWIFLHFNHQFDWLNSLEINSLPEYLLIDPVGNIALRNAPTPENNLSIFLKTMFYKEKEPNKNPLFHNRN